MVSLGSVFVFFGFSMVSCGFSLRTYMVFFESIMGFLGSRLVSIGFVRNLARCHCSGPLLPPYPPLLRVIRRSGPLWPPLGLSFLCLSITKERSAPRSKNGLDGNAYEKQRKTIVLEHFGAPERPEHFWASSDPLGKEPRAVKPGQTHCKTNRKQIEVQRKP